MARGASQSQASSSTSGRAGFVGIVPRGSAAVAAGMRRQRVGASDGGGSGGSGSNMVGFYTVDAPGLKFSPTVVLVKSWSQRWRRIRRVWWWRSGSNMLGFYTDDAPGLKFIPTVVLVKSLCFIGFVTALIP
ncbi:PREDICTED: uncharacterized protein LOC104601004 [Nelumbo nucifera]|uniref:Uncharacterized protein n=2 Tax=Nelumbo nucifera TaxID=4432 RepID=A0A822Z184_NELNU|nr:PREDICTED: uncharacterized protein LOC104601004 [Nelumbo nucifera]DAD36756.1 TPA_asm: hypothetical protein HUJ06_007397 [Nelumbo nucifera]